MRTSLHQVVTPQDRSRRNTINHQQLKRPFSGQHPRRRFLRIVAGAAALPAASRIARAQAYPTRPVRVIVAAAAGGPTDLIARLMGQWLSDRLGQQFIIENRPGGSNNIGTEAVVRAAPDGHTLLLANAVNAINASLFERLSYDFMRDIEPVATIAQSPIVVVVHPSLPASTIPEFISYAKANSAKVNMGSPGNGTVGHVAGELFKLLAGVDMVHVPYRGGAPMVTDLLGGQVQVALDNVATSIEYIRSGKLRALGVTTPTRWAGLPDVPAIREFLPGFEASAWYGFGAPRNTPAEIVRKLNVETNSALRDPKIKSALADLGFMAVPGSPADFANFIAEETAKWAKVVKLSGAKPD